MPVTEGEGEESGTSKLSELGRKNCIEDELEADIKGTDEDMVSGTSQNSPVNSKVH